MSEKVYCKECEFYRFVPYTPLSVSRKERFCWSPNNKTVETIEESYLQRSFQRETFPSKSPMDINKRNDCQWFEPIEKVVKTKKWWRF